jgi:hypothetical protein
VYNILRKEKYSMDVKVSLIVSQLTNRCYLVLGGKTKIRITHKQFAQLAEALGVDALKKKEK